MTEKVNCPLCGNESLAQPIKTWQFRDYEVRRYLCEQCKDKFNIYRSPKSIYTIPKALSR